jgi:Lrp/AsnC family transcriptional regulator for asnA, asnC and gidA
MTGRQESDSSNGDTRARIAARAGRATSSEKASAKDRNRSDGAGGPRRADDVDRRIITLLTADARLSARAIARELSMSPGAIIERIDRLEGAGIITGYHASVDIAALGFPVRAIVGVQVDRGDDALAGVVDGLMAMRNVQTVKLVTGEWDLLVEIVVQDNAQLREVLIDTIARLPGVTATTTMINLETRQRPGSWSPI